MQSTQITSAVLLILTVTLYGIASGGPVRDRSSHSPQKKSKEQATYRTLVKPPPKHLHSRVRRDLRDDELDFLREALYLQRSKSRAKNTHVIALGEMPENYPSEGVLGGLAVIPWKSNTKRRVDLRNLPGVISEDQEIKAERRLGPEFNPTGW